MTGFRMPRRVLAAVAAASGLVAGVAVSAPPGALPTTAARTTDRAVSEAYPRFDAKGRPAGRATWRVTRAGGNCCEVLLAATSKGRLLEFGGSRPLYSDDKGRTWVEISPVVPSTQQLAPSGSRATGGGEGTIVMAPGGDIVGLAWDAYSGDRLQSFLYDASDRSWHYQEVPVHDPFYDRPWVAVAKGPFTIAGQTVPWVSLVLSAYTRNVVLMSLDGLSYFTPSARDLDVLRRPRVARALAVTRDPELDYLQGHSETSLVPVAGGGALSFDETKGSGCAMQLLQPDGSWACFTLPGAVAGRLQVDSRGWLHDVSTVGTSLTYRISRDGGRRWSSRTFALPGAITDVESFDYKAHGRLGLSAIAVHARSDDDTTQDMVLRLDTGTGAAVLRDTLFVGDGNLQTTAGLDVEALVTGRDSPRFDFATVAVLPDGTIAVGFADRTYDDPAVAVLA